MVECVKLITLCLFMSLDGCSENDEPRRGGTTIFGASYRSNLPSISGTKRLFSHVLHLTLLTLIVTATGSYLIGATTRYLKALPAVSARANRYGSEGFGQYLSTHKVPRTPS
jgi:hypothetical protein